MFCTTCGAPNPDNASICKSCGAALTNPYQASATPMGASDHTLGTRIPNYLVQAILVTLCCCLPFGIPAIVYAAQVDGKFAARDYTGARESSNNAKMWCWISFGLGLLCQGGYLIVVLLSAVADIKR